VPYSPLPASQALPLFPYTHATPDGALAGQYGGGMAPKAEAVKLKQTKLSFRPGPERGGPRLAPDVAEHVAAERAAAEERHVLTGKNERN
jgi:hypothetical protein